MKNFAKRLGLITLAAVLLVSGAWGQTYLIQEGFSTASLPTDWSGDVYFNTTANIGNLSGTYGAGFNANDKYLQTPAVNSPGTLTFWFKGSAASSQISLKVQKSVGGGAFIDIATYPKPHTTTAIKYTINVNDVSENVVFKFVAYERTGNSIYLDDIELTDYTPTGVDDPTGFSADPTSTSQINLTWTNNGNGDDVMVVYDEDNSFTDPENGETYTGSALGGTVIYQGDAEAFNHSSLSSNTQYFYKAWSVSGADAYSSGVTANATTLKDEPSNHATSFTVSTTGYTSLTLTWTDATGSVLPDKYLIKGSSVGYGDIAAPSDGTAESDDALVKNVTQGTQSVTFTGLSDNTTYYFEIWPYTNTGTDVNYKTDGSAPQISGTTYEIKSLPFSENFDYTGGEYLTNHDWVAHSAAGAYPIEVISPGLEFSSYSGSGIGNAANLNPGANSSEDVHLVFDEITSGSIYVSFIIKTSATNAAGYFLNLGQQVIGATYFSRVWVNATGDGVGIGTSAPDPYVSITADVPTLLVLKYTIASGVTDLYVCSSLPSTEPLTPDATFTEGSSYNVGSIALRQYSSSQDIIVDGIRIATSWNDAPLPICLASFTAEALNGKVNVSWVTESETENAAFRIYRDGEMIAELEGAGTTSEPQSYSWTDNYVIPGRTYSYVLADVDYQGKETKHPRVEVEVEAEYVDQVYTIGAAYPNPFNPVTLVPLNLAKDAVVTATLYDITGRPLRELQNGSLSAGSHDLRIDGTNLSTGIYFVRVRVNDATHVQKIALMK